MTPTKNSETEDIIFKCQLVYGSARIMLAKTLLNSLSSHQKIYKKQKE